ncbi:hypothetical protein IJT17_00470 [bacterium]|nr:hypothetical protein [bacterium]
MVLSRLSAAFLASVMLGSIAITGCASDIGGAAADNPGGDHTYLHFKLSVNPNGVIDRSGSGYYVILLNSRGEEIEVTDIDTFTDFIKYDGVNFDWYTRQANQPNPGWTFAMAGSLNTEGSVASDGHSIEVAFNLSDSSSMLSQYVISNKFTAHAITTDTYQDAILGRVIDVMGDSLDGNSLQTVLVSKLQGAIKPFPTYYPNDRLNDWITHGDLEASFPYVNYDIASLQITSSRPDAPE